MTEFITSNITPVLSVLTVFSHVVILIVVFMYLIPKWFGKVGYFVRHLIHIHVDIIILVLTGFSVVGSLLYSNLIGFDPCSLCWWERIFIYPTLIIVLIAMIRKEVPKLMPYVFGLSLPGIIFSGYHTYLQLGGKAFTVCSSTGVDCAKIYFIEFGYITLPTMALTAYVIIATVSLLSIIRNRIS